MTESLFGKYSQLFENCLLEILIFIFFHMNARDKNILELNFTYNIQVSANLKCK